MKKPDRQPNTNGFVRCPKRILFDATLSYAARIVWLAIESHRWDGKKTCWPSYRWIAKEVGASERYVRDVVLELEAKGYLIVKRTNGKYSVYKPVIPAQHSVGTDNNPDVIASRLSTKPMNHSVTVDTDFNDEKTQNRDVIVPTHRDVIVPTNKNKGKRINKEEESADADVSISSKSKKPKKPKKPQSEIPKDPARIREALDNIDLVKFRKEWVHKIDFEDVWNDFQDYVLEGNPQNPTPNPKGYKAGKGFDLALGNFCKNRLRDGWSRGKANPQPTTVSIYDQDLTNYKF